MATSTNNTMFHFVEKKKRDCAMDSSFLLQKVSKKLHPFLKEYLQIAFNMKHVSKKESAFSITVPHCQTPFTNSFQLHTA